MSGSDKGDKKAKDGWCKKVLKMDPAEIVGRAARNAGIVVTDQLIDLRDAKLVNSLTQLEMQSQRLSEKELCLPWMNSVNKLGEARKAALKLTDNKKKSDALDPLKSEAEKLLDKLPEVQSTLDEWSVVYVQRAKAEHLVDLASEHAKKPNNDPSKLTWLVPIMFLQGEIEALDRDCKKDAPEAFKKWGSAYNQFAKVVDQYQEHVGKPLLSRAKKAKQQNPTGPEATLETLYGSEEYEKRLARLAFTAEAFKSNISQVSPGEALALFEYTTGKYVDINEWLLKLPGVAKWDSDRQNKARVLAGEVVKAMKKLPPVKIDFTMRGEKKWPGCEEQYVLGKTFAISQFWSTGVTFKFDCYYRINVLSNGSARSLGAFSNFPNEREILYLPGTKFKVTKFQEFVEEARAEVTVQAQ